VYCFHGVGNPDLSVGGWRSARGGAINTPTQTTKTRKFKKELKLREEKKRRQDV